MSELWQKARFPGRGTRRIVQAIVYSLGSTNGDEILDNVIYSFATPPSYSMCLWSPPNALDTPEVAINAVHLLETSCSFTFLGDPFPFVFCPSPSPFMPLQAAAQASPSSSPSRPWASRNRYPTDLWWLPWGSWCNSSRSLTVLRPQPALSQMLAHILCIHMFDACTY